MSKTKTSLGVDWHLPAKRPVPASPDFDEHGRWVGGYQKRRFATTTQATSNLIELFAEGGADWHNVRAAAIYDRDAQAVANGFISAGHGHFEVARYVQCRRVQEVTA